MSKIFVIENRETQAVITTKSSMNMCLIFVSEHERMFMNPEKYVIREIPDCYDSNQELDIKFHEVSDMIKFVDLYVYEMVGYDLRTTIVRERWLENHVRTYEYGVLTKKELESSREWDHVLPNRSGKYWIRGNTLITMEPISEDDSRNILIALMKKQIKQFDADIIGARELLNNLIDRRQILLDSLELKQVERLE